MNAAWTCPRSTPRDPARWRGVVGAALARADGLLERAVGALLLAPSG
ncbi:MAG TPA: hypothetical protein VFQ45_20410 [Longimicrobium sp.]|nr:hypothetical protein [Longimicrobium sp.]